MNMILSSNMLAQMMCNKIKIDCTKLTRRAHVFLGTKCSYKCAFCYGNNKRNIEFIKFDNIIKYIDFLYAYGINAVEYTGGEPIECNYILDVVKYVKEKYNLHQSIITNGSGDIDLYKKLYNLGVKDFLFSLHGYNKSSHEKITGILGSWDKINNVMKELQKNDITLRINVTICEYNYNNLIEQLLYIIENYPKVFMINYLPMNSWDNAIIRHDISVPYKLYTDSFIELYKITKKYNIKMAIRYIPFCAVNKSLWPCIYNHLQHAYDIYDWNQELDGKNIYSEYLQHPYGYYTLQSILNKRKSLYVKFNFCTCCENFYICDGYQKNQIIREGLN